LRSAAAVQRKYKVVIFVVPPSSTHIGERGDPGAEASVLDSERRWLGVVERHVKALLPPVALSN
jgi:hypothetical protein